MSGPAVVELSLPPRGGEESACAKKPALSCDGAGFFFFFCLCGDSYFLAGVGSGALGSVVISKVSVRKGVSGRPSLLARLHTGLLAQA